MISKACFNTDHKCIDSSDLLHMGLARAYMRSV